ncbi:hypothetical protein IGI04_033686 [Brassica rapa subsp. trilocularis]|uniref:RNase H type-1 domain-containing protein n=1 Tax=Brassica rapa subsp. trilocularis TaxID=1813537 RepID=A0ABQ7L6K7_BRACM|nr:hypothetical protein IGI04_033686 [Brassica rapa subsp. trilocularis]
MASSVLKNPQVQPSENTTRCNTDAAWNKASKAAGLACIFKNNTGIEVHRASWNQDFVTSPLMAEAMAVRLALLTAASLDIFDLQVRSDNQTVLRAITRKQQIKEIYDILADINRLSLSFASLSFVFTPCSENAEADGLAKSSLRLFLSISGPPIG